MAGKTKSVFWGANTSSGYVFNYTPAESGKTLILKGAPGCGQEELIEKIGVKAKRRGENLTLIHNPYNALKLDGIFLQDSNVRIIDGSINQRIDPSYMGLCENIVDFGELVSCNALAKNRAEIFRLYDYINDLKTRTGRFLSAAGTLMSDSFQLVLACADITKIKVFAEALAKKHIPKKILGTAKEERVYLGALTCGGSVFFEDTIRSSANNILVIEDEYGPAARIIMYTIRRYALEAGIPFTTCFCSFFGESKIDHIIFPTLSLAFCTSGRYHPVENYERRYHLRRFTNAVEIRTKKQRLSFNRRAAAELLDGAKELLAEKEAAQNLLASLYSDALDREALEKKIISVADRIY